MDDYRFDNHRTKKKGAKKGSKKQYEPFDGAAFLKQLQKEKADAVSTKHNPKK